MNRLWKIIVLILELFQDRNLKPVTEPDPISAPDPDPVPPVPSVPPATPPAPVESEENDPEEYGPATKLVLAMKRKGYDVFEDNSKDYNLNIVAERNTGARLDEFGCRIHVFWKQPEEQGGEWRLLSWKATTYPGRRYLVERLLNPRGAAILVPGQYPVYKLDTHNGKYEALCQRRGPVRVYRDGDRDSEFDLVPSSVMEGMFGMNVHAPVTPRSGYLTYVAQRVYAASAGCQVFQSVSDFLEFRTICNKAKDLWGNAFTLTLLKDTDLHEIDITLPVPTPVADEFDDLEGWDPGANTTGIRNRNLLNVKGEGWRYSLGHDDRGHNIFPTFAKGLRAGIITLRSYWTRHQRKTIYDILARWAPETDTIGSLPGAPPNSPRKYSLFVASRMDHQPGAPLSLFHEDGSVNDAEQLYHLVAAMAAYESSEPGGPRVGLPREIFDEAVLLL